MDVTMLSIVAACLLCPIPDYKLVWSDEFDRPGMPDPRKWTFEKGYVRNHELQFYTNRKENVRVEDGKLVIEARKDHWDGHDVTSASVTTDGLASWTYGKFEIRAKIPTGKGTWPAIWTLGTNIGKVGWPTCGEIDIMENVGFDPSRIHFNVHQKKGDKGTSILTEKPWADFHVYGAEWTPQAIDFYFDGKKQFSYPKTSDSVESWPYDAPQYLILNLAMGGDWGGQQGVDESIYPSKYEIDYVRVYQK